MMVALEKFGAKTAFEMGVVCTPFQFGIARSEGERAFRTLAPGEYREITVGESVKKRR